MRGLYRVAEAGRPACMTEHEHDLWLEANGRLRDGGVSSPCSDCPLSFATEMRRHDQCDGIPGFMPWRPREGPEPEFMIGRTKPGEPRHVYATQEERIAARRASWRASGARKRAAAAAAMA